MARFYGEVGYGNQVEMAPGVYEDQIIERKYYGDLVRNTRSLSAQNESVNDNLTVGNSISVIADAYAFEHFFNIRYIRWAGTLWEAENVEVQAPRLLIRLGGVYHGPTARVADSP